MKMETLHWLMYGLNDLCFLFELDDWVNFCGRAGGLSWVDQLATMVPLEIPSGLVDSKSGFVFSLGI